MWRRASYWRRPRRSNGGCRSPPEPLRRYSNPGKSSRAILERRDSRLFVVVGPCSIHDVVAAREYATRLKELASRVESSMLLIMRVYFEKPRTTVGWKGLINDPDLDDSFHIEKGILLARELLLYIAELGLPAGTEALDPIMPQYLSELITWTAIGARTTESQTHREMASGLSTPVGFKNGTDGALGDLDQRPAVGAASASFSRHHAAGTVGGVPHARQSRTRISCCAAEAGGSTTTPSALRWRNGNSPRPGLPATIVVDCSHGNSNRDPGVQPHVAENCVAQIVDGNRSIVGLMLESHLQGGSQPIPEDLSKLEYGLSITDPCIDWSTTENLLLKLHDSLQNALRPGA